MRTIVPAMSPSTITASTGWGRLRASCAAPAAPTEALVDASTTERCCVCEDEHLGELEQDRRCRTDPRRRRRDVESRCATITIEPGVRPASVPVTVWIVRGPSIVCALKRDRWTGSPSLLNAPATSFGDPSSPAEPGGRTGNCVARLRIVAYAVPPLNASGASVACQRAAWLPSENATTITATATTIRPVL